MVLIVMEPMDDATLIEALRAGDREAMRLLYDRHKDGLFTLARTLLGDASAAEDVVHDVFVSFIGSIERCRVNGGLRGYLATCVANRARDRIRLAVRRARRSRSSTLRECWSGGASAGNINKDVRQKGSSQRRVLCVFWTCRRLPQRSYLCYNPPR